MQVCPSSAVPPQPVEREKAEPAAAAAQAPVAAPEVEVEAPAAAADASDVEYDPTAGDDDGEDESEDPFAWPPKGECGDRSWQVLFLDEATNSWQAGYTVAEDQEHAVRVRSAEGGGGDDEDEWFERGDAALRFMAPA